MSETRLLVKFVRLMETTGAVNPGLFGTRRGRLLDCVAELCLIDTEAEISGEQLLLFSVMWTLKVRNGRGSIKRSLQSKVPRASSLSCAAETAFSGEGASELYSCTMSRSSSAVSLPRIGAESHFLKGLASKPGQRGQSCIERGRKAKMHADLRSSSIFLKNK